MSWRVLPLLILVTVIAGGTPIAVHAAVVEFPPLTVAAARFAIAGLCLGITCRLMGRPIKFPREDRRSLIWLAALCVPINQLGYLVGVKLAGAAHGGTLLTHDTFAVAKGMFDQFFDRQVPMYIGRIQS